MILNKHTLRCLNDHMGHWMMHEGRFWQLHNFIMSHNHPPLPIQATQSLVVLSLQNSLVLDTEFAA